jgi:BASS family bile acid:Na+ symporter
MQDGNVVTQILLPVSLAIIMLSVGLELTIADFKRVVVQPKDFFIGALSQVVLLPAVAFALVSVWSMDPALAVGVMILAACPGGVTSNLMTYLARGDTALSVSLTAIISLLSVLTLPFIVAFSVAHFMDGARAPEISVGRMIVGVFAITTVPVAIGMTIKRFAPRFAANFERTARIISSILFVLVIAGAVYSERENIVDYFRQAGPATLMLNLIMMATAYSLAKAARLGGPQQTAITLECGLQNGTLAIFVAVTLIGNTTMMVPGGIYSLLMFATAGAYMFVTRRRGAAAPAQAR